MIPFFRKIRKKMADDNRPLQYVRYAIGEIVLVVIGILIALQVNNWNEGRRESILQRKILKEIEANLELDLVEIQEDINIMDSISNACGQVLLHLEREDKPSKTFNYRMASIRANPHFDPNQSGYSLLVSKGLDIIRNDSLREYISVLYESNYAYYKRYEEERTQFKIQHIYPQLLKWTKLQYEQDLYLKAIAIVSPEDYQGIKGDADFVKFISAISNENKMVQDRALIMKSRIQGLSELIRSELNSK